MTAPSPHPTPPAAIKSPVKAAKIQQSRPFQPGNRGRPKGSRNRATLLREALLAGTPLAQYVLAEARRGDQAAAKVILSAFLPRPAHTRDFELPPVETAQDAADAMGLVLQAIGAGELAIKEGARLCRMLEQRLNALQAAR
jgi:hypothetical protein